MKSVIVFSLLVNKSNQFSLVSLRLLPQLNKPLENSIDKVPSNCRKFSAGCDRSRGHSVGIQFAIRVRDQHGTRKCRMLAEGTDIKRQSDYHLKSTDTFLGTLVH